MSLGTRIFSVKEKKHKYKNQISKKWLIFFLFLIYLFYFWLLWVFVAVRRLSLVAVSGGYSSLRCAGFSLQWLLFVAEHGL